MTIDDKACIESLCRIQAEMISKHAKEGYYFTPPTDTTPGKWRKVSWLERAVRAIFGCCGMLSTTAKCELASTRAFLQITTTSASEYESQLKGALADSPMKPEFEAKIKCVVNTYLHEANTAKLDVQIAELTAKLAQAKVREEEGHKRIADNVARSTARIQELEAQAATQAKALEALKEEKKHVLEELNKEKVYVHKLEQTHAGMMPSRVNFVELRAKAMADLPTA